MKSITIQKSSDIPEKSKIQVFTNGKLTCIINNYLKHKVEITEVSDEIEFNIKWQWCGNKSTIMIKDGMMLKISPNKFVGEKYKIICLFAGVILIPLTLVVNYVFFLFFMFLFLPPLYYITFGRNKYLNIKQI